MGKLVVSTFTTLDGVMQAPGTPDEDGDGGFTHGGWQMPLLDEESGDVVVEAMSRFDALLLGRRTYEIFAAFWPHAPGDDPIAVRLNGARKYVASRTLTTVDWKNSALLTGDLASAVTELKAIHDEIFVPGSGNLVQSLMAHDLVDEFNVWIYPLVLGAGKRLFAEGTLPTWFDLVDSRVTGGGVVIATYRRSGNPEYGAPPPPN